MATDVSHAICVSVSRWKTGVASSTRLAPALRIRAISSSGLMSRPGFDRCQRRYPSTAASTAFVIEASSVAVSYTHLTLPTNREV